MNNKICCFIGHRKISFSDGEIENLYNIIEKLIIEKNVDTFLLGSKSEFDNLCLKIVSDLKRYYSNIKRIYVRAEFPYIDKKYKTYLLKIYDETYYPYNILNAGKCVYVERNCHMIDKSDFCVFFFDENYTTPNNITKSGTKIAYNYALKKKKDVINVFDKSEKI